LLNPAVRALSKVGLRTALATDLETVGRKTGQIRRVPVSAQFDDGGAWIISRAKHCRESECPPAPEQKAAYRSGDNQAR